MKSVTNKTHQALKLRLSQGKVLHLGPRQTGHISFHDADSAAIKKMVEAGQLEMFDEAGNPAIPSREDTPAGAA